MTSDDPFRLALLLILAAILPFAVWYRVRSHSGERLDRWQEGAFILFGLRLSALAGFAGGIAWMLEPEWMRWSSVPLPDWLRWCGVAGVGLWGVLVVWTFRHLGGNLTDTVVTRKDHTLVTTGPYRWVRHPFYLAFAVAVAGGVWRPRTGICSRPGWFPLAFSSLGRGSKRRSWSSDSGIGTGPTGRRPGPSFRGSFADGDGLIRDDRPGKTVRHWACS